MTKTLDQIETELAAAETLIRTLRGEREAALTAACPHRVGDIFTTNGREYRVQKVSPGGRGAPSGPITLASLTTPSLGCWRGVPSVP